jgi:hypothetical protein
MAQKKGWESNCQFDSQSLKVRNCPNFLAYKWHVTCHWKVLDKGYNFTSDLTSIEGLHTKLWASKVVGVPILRILGLPLRSPRRKWHLGVDPVARHREYYKGEGVGFLKYGPWWVLWILWVHVCSWFVHAPKVF